VEIHLSHNQLGTAGAKTLLAAVPTARPQGLRPLWFRVEYNQINARELETFINEVGAKVAAESHGCHECTHAQLP
jgi:hypothetical protein